MHCIEKTSDVCLRYMYMGTSLYNAPETRAQSPGPKKLLQEKPQNTMQGFGSWLKPFNRILPTYLGVKLTELVKPQPCWSINSAHLVEMILITVQLLGIQLVHSFPYQTHYDLHQLAKCTPLHQLKAYILHFPGHSHRSAAAPKSELCCLNLTLRLFDARCDWAHKVIRRHEDIKFSWSWAQQHLQCGKVAEDLVWCGVVTDAVLILYNLEGQDRREIYSNQVLMGCRQLKGHIHTFLSLKPTRFFFFFASSSSPSDSDSLLSDNSSLPAFPSTPGLAASTDLSIHSMTLPGLVEHNRSKSMKGCQLKGCKTQRPEQSCSAGYSQWCDSQQDQPDS